MKFIIEYDSGTQITVDPNQLMLAQASEGEAVILAAKLDGMNAINLASFPGRLQQKVNGEAKEIQATTEDYKVV